MSSLLLLPGLDGTARLFQRFLSELPADLKAQALPYPADRLLGIEALADRVGDALSVESKVVIVTESFSGPVAVTLAARRPANLAGLVLVASFVTSPVAGWLRPIVRGCAGIGARLPLPEAAIAHWLTGADRGLAREVQSVVADVRREVIAARLRLLTTIDVRAQLHGCPVPILCLVGENDRIVPRACAEEIQTLRPDVHVRTLPAPHLVLQTQPRESAAEILAFLGRLG